MLVKKEKERKQALPSQKDHLSNIAIDCVVFGYHEKELKVICSKIQGMEQWSLPGGHVRIDENIEDAAYRILELRTNVKGLFLQQFKTFGHKDRCLMNTDFPSHLTKVPRPHADKIRWLLTNRFVSICYYALTEFSKVVLQPGFFDSACTWVDIHNLPPLILDHREIFEEALLTLRREIHYQPIGLNLLPEKFTLPELKALYETILGKKLDQRNFTKKIISLDIIRRLDEKKYIGGHRAPTLYKFNKRAYNKALRQGVELAF
jgi:8-oxo-dGTP diphosphatase